MAGRGYFTRRQRLMKRVGWPDSTIISNPGIRINTAKLQNNACNVPNPAYHPAAHRNPVCDCVAV